MGKNLSPRAKNRFHNSQRCMRNAKSSIAPSRFGRSRQHRYATERATKVWADHFTEIAELEKRRVLLAIELQKVN